MKMKTTFFVILLLVLVFMAASTLPICLAQIACERGPCCGPKGNNGVCNLKLCCNKYELDDVTSKEDVEDDGDKDAPKSG